MISLARRRIYGSGIVAFAVLVFWLGNTSYDLSLWETGFATGWVLFGLMIALTVFNVRKKLPFLPLLSSSVWLQVHTYLGIFTVFCFAWHVGWQRPNGWFEGSVALLYGTVVVSGFVGLGLSRRIPGRLQTRGEQVIFERHPVLLRQLREQQLLPLIDGVDSVPLHQFYLRRLIAFFDRPRHFWWHVIQSNRPRYTLLRELDALGRYLDPEETRVRNDIASLIGQKDDLDYHYAHQALLKYWLFVHVPLSYTLLIVAVAHAIVAYAYRG